MSRREDGKTIRKNEGIVSCYRLVGLPAIFIQKHSFNSNLSICREAGKTIRKNELIVTFYRLVALPAIFKLKNCLQEFLLASRKKPNIFASE